MYLDSPVAGKANLTLIQGVRRTALEGGDKDHLITAIRDAFHVAAALVSIDAKVSILAV